LPDQYRFSAVDALAAEFQRQGGQPGLAYGVVADGRLVHEGGLGERWLGGPSPDAATVFRIASMTKSFTAAAILALRDDGALGLDDPAVAYVPELAGLPRATADSPPVTIRNLLTMTAGFPTDDPWGDRQQGLPLAEFAALLGSGGLRFAWAPGTRFEYSNLGYAILGLVIAKVSDRPYPELITQRLLRPLGMTSTGFEASGFPAGRLARGYQRSGDRWDELQPDPCGAFAPMGGIFSCVADLARWVSGLGAAFPPRAGEDGSGLSGTEGGDSGAGAGDLGQHPLRQATRREMQLPQVSLGSGLLTRFPGDPDITGPASYGLGLFVEEHPAWGRIVQHTGGYPGFGSNMRWHPATGLGVIVLANSTYAAAPGLAAQMLIALLRQQPAAAVPGMAGKVAGPAPAPGGPWPQTRQAQQEIMGLLRSWDDMAAARLFTPNVDQDQPLPERRHAIELLRERIGEFAEHPERPPEFESPAHCRWWLAGERGVAAAEIRLSPERSPRVQALAVAVPPAPGSPLADALGSLLSLLNGDVAGWPPSLPVAGSLDTDRLARQFRMAAAWAGRCRLGALRAGNGETAATTEIDGETGRLVLAISIDPAAPLLHQVDLFVQP
jgi:CubicO group peptidase (beta-lactamase class C family)